MIKVLADKYLYELESMLPPEVDIQWYDPAEPLPAGPVDCDALLTRTVTPVNRETLNRFSGRLSFVGTGSSGTDHVDRPLLEERGIAFSDAAGCNARSVAEYVVAALLLWSDERGVRLDGRKVGIVGVGHAGGRLARLLEPFPVTTVLHDPPRAERESGFQSATREEVLGCDILTFHLPLTDLGPYRTRHWLDGEILRNHRYRLVINTARGGVVDERALLEAEESGSVDDFILDVWEEEPFFRRESAEAAFAATPHIAGYSIQAKQRATRMIVEPLCRKFGLTPASPPQEPEITVRLRNLFDTPPSAGSLVTALHPLRTYQARLLEILPLPADRQGASFNSLRSTFPLRNEFGSMRLEDADLLSRKIPLGFRNLFR